VERRRRHRQGARDLKQAFNDTEIAMSSTIAGQVPAIRTRADTAVDMKLEVIVVPVSDVDRAKRFYGGLGWRLDADFATADGWRVVQLTPPGSTCSILLGHGITTAAPGSLQGPFLVVEDIEAARAELEGRGAVVSAVFHFDGGLHVTGTNGRVAGLDPERQSYRSWASFADPDGNGWMIQEIKARLPGRGLGSDVASLTDLLREAEDRHGTYEASAAKHHWSDWYAAYIVARQRGETRESAGEAAASHVEDITP
jgi:catechol 2,3-dioxygenase-like lactoylglutathione lyase family enzyme